MKNYYTYVHLIDGKPIYVGEGNKRRARRPEYRSPEHQEFMLNGDVDVVVVGNHSDKVSAQLNEQGLISWIGIDKLFNKKPYHLAGIPHTDEWKEEARKRATGVKKSKETKRKLREHFLGTVRDPEVCKRISETKKRNKLTCPHCGKVGGVSNMRRYHFDNCKHKP